MHDTKHEPTLADPAEGTLRTQLMEVTPVMAAKWLADYNRPDNRPLSQLVARQYAAEMREGRWALTHQGPAFDTSNQLLDGQHRLAAIVIADVTVPMYVTFGADPDTFVVIDINYKRQPGHLLSHPYAKQKAAAARFLTTLPRFSYANKLHNRDVVRIVSEHPQIENAARIATVIYGATRISSALHTALLTVVLESPVANRVDDWTEGLVTGAGLDPGDPRLPLRNRWALESQFLNSGSGRSIGMFLLVRSWNAYVTGASMSKLQLPRGGGAKSSDVPDIVTKV